MNNPARGLRQLMRSLYKNRWAYFFIMPKFLLFLVFIGIPVVWAFIISFQKFRAFDTVWVGLENFRQVLSTGLYRKAFWNTVKYTLVTVPTHILIALILASLIHPLSKRAQTFFRAAFYLPTVTSMVIIAMVWRWMFNSRFGLLNYLLGLFGLGPIDWLNSSNWAMWAIIIMSILTPPGVGVILYLAAMASIPESLYEAAAIDGAGPFQRWVKITLPLLKPTTLYLVILSTVGSFQVFTQVLMLTGGGPGHATTTLVTLIYETAFRDGNFGLASAQAIILFGIILVISLLQYKLLHSETEY